MSKSQKPFGRPQGSGKYNKKFKSPSVGASYRLSIPCKEFIKEQGGREFLESLVPQSYRKEYARKLEKLLDNEESTTNE